MMEKKTCGGVYESAFWTKQEVQMITFDCLKENKNV